MAPILAASTACSNCHEQLNSKGECLACLLRGGLSDADEVALHSLAFGDFEIARREDGSLWELGCGAMGVTYRATDRVLHRVVALKVIEVPPSAGDSQAVRQRFLREARAAAALRHPNVASVFQFGAPPDTNRCFYAMELVEGETLEARVRRDGPLTVNIALEVAVQVTRALVAAAGQGLIHRDVKPGNIMLKSGDTGTTALETKVIDFGLAKAIADGAGDMDLTHGGFVGTPTFASPEQFRSGPIDARSDIYSLGVTLWYALTGNAPFSGRTIEELRDAPARANLPVGQLIDRKVPNSVIGLLRRVLAVDPERRPASARELMQILEACRGRLSSTRGFSRKTIGLVAIMAITAAALFAFRLSWYKAAVVASPATLSTSGHSLPEKSIAVLPLENLSIEKDDAFFADGIHDDILTSLAKINDLKVISRTSVLQYRGAGAARNLREIARQLDVEDILEGSVRRVGDRVVVNVQLIDARNDRHTWAERYERAITDSAGLPGEIAAQVAASLQVQVLPEERARLSAKPTSNFDAYFLYLSALKREGIVNRTMEDTIAAEQLYEKATVLDPKFALAFARASLLNSFIHSNMDEPARKPKARRQAEEAIRLSPTLGEAHLALGLCLYWGDKDYPAALREFSRAVATCPNNSDVLNYFAGIYRRQGRWRESLASLQRAQNLDPRNQSITTWAAFDYLYVRDWSGATACYNRALEIQPDSVRATIGLAYMEVFRNNNPDAGREILRKIAASTDPDGRVTEANWDLAMLARDFVAAEKILTEFPLEDFPVAGEKPKAFFQGRIALARGNVQLARRLFEAIRPPAEDWVRENPRDPGPHALLGLLYAYLQRKEDAIREGRRAVELEPESKNAFHGAVQSGNLALIYAQTGEADQAVTLIERLLATPGSVQWPDFPQNMTLADLRLRWEWDPLRSNPRFQKILAGPEPKTIY